MRRDAYPGIGRRITISQGTKGPEQAGVNGNEQAQLCNPLGQSRVMPAKAGIHTTVTRPWIPACEGVTSWSSAIPFWKIVALPPSGRVDDEFVVRPLRRGKCVLCKAHKTVARVIEHAKATFANLYGLLIPSFCEEGALGSKRLDEYLDLSVAKSAGEVGAKFGEQPFRPVLPVGNELTSGGLEGGASAEGPRDPSGSTRPASLNR